MRCIIIEDQPPAQRLLQKYIADVGTLELIGVFSDAVSALDVLKTGEVDLIFLDIHLPKLSGIDFLKTLQSPPSVILTTAFADYALESYELEVVDYLLKPFSFARFVKAVSRVPVKNSFSESFDSHGKENDEDLFIKSGYDHFRVAKNDVILIGSDADYTELVTTQRKLLSNESLRYWLERLNGFIQVHKSYLVNTKHILKVSGNQVYLTNDQVVPIGRAYKEDFMKSFG